MQAAQVSNSNELNSYRIWHANKTVVMFQVAYREHRQQSPGCAGDLELDTAAEQQRGLAWRERLMCRKCGYISAYHQLYNTLEGQEGSGPRTADINQSVHVGLSHTGIAVTGLSRLLLAMNIPCPAPRHMQRTANQVMEGLTQENQANMDGIRNGLLDLNQHRGLPRSHPIQVEMDARYNNPMHSGTGRTPFQAATQMVQVTCEQSTSQKKIIAVNVRSKLCQSARLQEQRTGKRVNCPHHSGHCSANLPMEAVIGE